MPYRCSGSRRAGALLWLLCGACASSPKPPAAQIDEAFAAIQVHEARIEHARAAALRADTSCDAQCTAARSAQKAAGELCEVSASIADPDALARCEAARGSADSILKHVAERCTCGARTP